jgi:histidine triad (HIT) family protein
MSFTEEQAKNIKSQLLQQVEQLPNENKDQIKKYIETLDDAGLEAFLKQQNIQVTDQGLQQGPASEGSKGQSETQSQPETLIFESIIKGDIPSHKIDENPKALAILELNPLSKGHTLVIPKTKTTIEKIPKTAFSLAQKIAKRIKSKLKPEEIKIETFQFQDYPAINIIPVYKDQPLNKTKAEESELKSLQKKLEFKTRSKRETKTTNKPAKNLPEISFRIP